MWKIKEEIYYSHVYCGLFTKEQNECHKEKRGSSNLLYIDQLKNEAELCSHWPLDYLQKNRTDAIRKREDQVTYYT